jgi:hypothetical protein
LKPSCCATSMRPILRSVPTMANCARACIALTPLAA